MHNNIMAAGSKDRPPMLATGRYAQWRSRFLRYIDTRPNGDALRKCILEGLYTLSTVIVPAIPATKNSPPVPEHTTLRKCRKLSKGYNKVNHSTFKMSIQTYFGSLENLPLTMEKQWNLITQGMQKAKRVKDSTYHKEKMLLCKQAEQGVPIQAEHVNWLADTDNEIDEQEPKAHYSFMAKIQEVVSPESNSNAEPLEQVQYNDEYNVFANVNQHCEQSETTSNTCLVKKDDSDVIPDSPDMCENDIQTDQNAEDKRVALANLIANLKLDVDENKKIQKQLNKANASLAHELERCKSILVETSKTLEESNSVRNSCLVALQTKQTEFKKYKAYNDHTVDYDKLERKLNETLGLLTQKDIDIKEGLKLKAYEISVVKEKHDELVKHSLLTKSHYEGLVKEKIKVVMDLKQKEDRDIDKMISTEKQLKFLNKIIYKRNQTIQTIHMLAPKGPTFNGRPTFANPMYLKKAQSEKPYLYEIPNDQSDPTNRLVPDREETLILAEESRSKLNKDFVRPYDYTKLNSLYEIFKPASQGNHE
nr:hypothetical protein [Tanacetum cinerariifolium]